MAHYRTSACLQRTADAAAVVVVVVVVVERSPVRPLCGWRCAAGRQAHVDCIKCVVVVVVAIRNNNKMLLISIYTLSLQSNAIRGMKLIQ